MEDRCTRCAVIAIDHKLASRCSIRNRDAVDGNTALNTNIFLWSGRFGFFCGIFGHILRVFLREEGGQRQGKS